jgi:hypothetical protein
MDKDFFSAITDRRDAYTRHVGVDDAVIEITFHTGRVVILVGVIDASEGWLQIEVRDKLDEETVISLATAYHQIANVQFVPRRQRLGRAGF